MFRGSRRTGFLRAVAAQKPRSNRRKIEPNTAIPDKQFRLHVRSLMGWPRTIDASDLDHGVASRAIKEPNDEDEIPVGSIAAPSKAIEIGINLI